MILRINLVHHYSSKFGNSQRSLLSPTGGVKSIVNTLFQEVTDHHNQKDGSSEALKLDPCWKLRSVACMVNTELQSESGL